jgi:hypothetical protein
MVSPYAIAKKTWIGGSSSLLDPKDQNPIVLSKKQLIEFGGADLEKLNFCVEYDVTELKYRANLSIALIFDKNTIVSQTDLKGVQGTAITYFRQRFLPQYDSMKTLGTHTLSISLKLRPQWTIWHLIKNYQDWKELQSVAESTISRQIVLTE